MTDRGDLREIVERSAPPRLRVGVLGPVTVRVDGVERTITARRQRAVLTCLALHADEPLSADRLLDEIWGDDLPDTGSRAVAYQIARLRTLLEPDRTGEGTLITTTDAGYTLHVAPDDVDVHRFERLTAAARDTLDTSPARCEELITEALATWRGRPFADLADEPFVDREGRRLEQRRALARRTLAEARIALGHHTDVIGELESLVADHPLEESLVHLLMTALDRSGRTADALRTYDALRRRLADELGIQPSHRLQQLERDLLTDEHGHPPAPDRAAPRPIPAPLTSFVGRTDEIAEITELLSSARLVTLIGFGGLGKTRLAQETARTIGDRFRDGVWYVDLTPITDPTLLADTMIAAGGLTVPPRRDPVEHLLARLADREALVVLDNCEHLVDDVAELATAILRAAPHVRLLATSRTHLGITGETLRPVRPLDTVSASDLFTARAQLARPGFVLDDTDRDTVERLVDRLDGIPLAIEMVAARLAVMSVEQIMEHLHDRIGLLTRPQPDERQRSLRAVMQWSYDLLDGPARTLLRRLSVCAGGFDLDAAVAIGGADPTSVAVTVDSLAHLVEASLVIFEDNHGSPRYRMLEVVRQHVAEALEPGERAVAARAHAHHYAGVAARIFELENVDQHTAMHLTENELGNLRSAIDWAYHHDEPRLGLLIACNARSYFFLNQMFRELLRWLQTGLDLVDDDDDDDVIAAAGVACLAAGNLADPDAHRAAFDRVKGGFDAVVDPRRRAELLSALSSFELETDPRTAERYTRAAIAMRASLPVREMALLNNRIDHSWFCGNLPDGTAILRRWEEIQAEMRQVQPGYDKILAGVAACEGRWDDVVRLTESTDDLEPMFAASIHTLRAEALAALGRHEAALGALAAVDPDSMERHRRCTDRVRAAIDLSRGRPGTAAEHLDEIVAQTTRDDRRLALGMHVASLLAVAAHDLGQHENAARLLGYAAAEQERLDIVLRLSDRPSAERAIAGCRVAIGDDRYDELAALGAETAWRDLPRPTLDAT